jgi:hypothetical protein
METITIPLSKGKLFLLLAGSVMFVAAGIWFWLEPENFSHHILNSVTTVKIVGVLAVIFFGACGVIAIRKLIDSNPGIIIDQHGIIDNSSGVSNGIIAWSEIEGIKTTQVHNQKFMLLMVTHPEARIESQPGSFKKRMMKINYRMYGTPICISSNSLQCSFDELYKTITASYNKYKR